MPEPFAALSLGLNPYGISFTMGLLGAGTQRANARRLSLEQYFDLAERHGCRGIEIHAGHIETLDAAACAALRDWLVARKWWVSLSLPSTRRLADGIASAQRIGAGIVRLALTPVLSGDRAARPDWKELVAGARRQLKEDAPRASEAGIRGAIENHQDFTAAELMEICAEAGENIGVCLDTGNPLAVGEHPVAFARTVASRVFHIHLKDYRVQWTREGYILARCPIGDGIVPLDEVVRATAGGMASISGRPAAASIEPGWPIMRHVRLLSRQWWNGYPARDAGDLAEALELARQDSLPEDADPRTPWERDAGPEDLLRYEMDELAKSVQNLRAMGWM